MWTNMISKWRFPTRFRNLRLSSKLIITYMLLTVVPMSLLGYISYYQYTKSIESQIGEFMPRSLLQAKDNIEKHMDELTALPELLYNSDDIVAILRRDVYDSLSELNRDQFIVNSYLARTFVSGNYTDVLGVFILSKGRLFDSARLGYSGLDASGNPFRSASDRTGGVRILLPSETTLAFDDGRPYMLIADIRWFTAY